MFRSRKTTRLGATCGTARGSLPRPVKIPLRGVTPAAVPVVRSAPIDAGGFRRMRRLALFFSLALLVCGLAVTAPPALAGSTDWAVNGTPLAPGQEVSVKFASITPFQVVAPDQGIDVTCTSWKAKGTLVGGETGTGELVKPKFAHCTQMEEGAPGPVKAKVLLTSVKLRTGFIPPAGGKETTKFELIGSICTFKKPRCEPAVEILGTAAGLGPVPGEAGNVVGFPEPPLSASTITIGGSPGELVGEAVFKLPRHAALSQAEP